MKLEPKWKALAVFAVIFGALLWITLQNNETKANIPDQDQKAKAAASNDQNQENKNPMAPVFTLKDLEGNSVSLSDYRGKLVFVNFWATWCGPCRMEIPHFVELVDKYGDDGFAILGITVDDPRNFDKIPDFAEQNSINYPVLYGTAQVVGMYGGVESIPRTFVIDKEGRALGMIVGARSYGEFESIIKQY